jgi:hypothetical protein
MWKKQRKKKLAICQSSFANPSLAFHTQKLGLMKFNCMNMHPNRKQKPRMYILCNGLSAFLLCMVMGQRKHRLTILHIQ